MAESISTPTHLKNQEFITSKICTECGFIKPATTFYFHKNKTFKDGLKYICKKCDSLQCKEYHHQNKTKLAKHMKEYYQQNKDYIKEYRYQNKEKISEYHKEYYQKNKDKISECHKEYIVKNKDKRTEYFKEYYHQNKNKISAYYKEYADKNKDKISEYRKEYQKEYYKKNKDKVLVRHKQYATRPEVRERFNERNREIYNKNPTYNLCNRIRRSLRHSIKNKNGSKSFEILGFTKESLMKHIEKQFKDGMSWEAFSRGEIHIDHKLPISKFNFKTTDDPDFKICWSLKNLQPMWAKENMSKNNKLEKPLQMSLSFSE